MKKNYCLLTFILTVLLVASCGKDAINNGETDDSSSSSSRSGPTHEEASDYLYDVSSANTITFSGTSITTSNSTNVSISGSTATITAEGTYLVSGSLSNGQLIVEAKGAVVKLILNGVTMANSSSSPFYIKKCKKAILILPDGTTNTVTDASSYASSDEPNAAIFSNSDLTIYGGTNGTGSLTVKGNCYDGIATDDGLIIKSGNVSVSAVDDAIRGKDYLIVKAGTITAKSTSTGHALKSNNDTDLGYGYISIEGGTFNLTSASEDGVHAQKRVMISGGTFSIAASGSQGIKADSSVLINGGTINITTSYEAIESFNITINAGSLSMVATNDGLNATAGTVAGGAEYDDGSKIYINGGYVYSSVSNGDGIDSNGSLYVTGGTIVIHGPASQPELGIDINGVRSITGGVLMASGPNSGNMIESFNSGTQNTVMMKFSSTKSANSIIDIRNNQGNDILTFAPSRSYYYVIFSSSTLSLNTTYTVYNGGSYSVSGVNGYYTGGTYTAPSSSLGTFTPTSTFTTVTLK